MLSTIDERIADRINARAAQVSAAVALLDDGATVPFIARYRKEATGGLDDSQLRTLEQQLQYLRELEQRREAVLASIDEQGKLTASLKADIVEADTKARLEDLYLPYKPKRRTRAQKAREAGLQPLADVLRQDPSAEPEQRAAAFVDAEQGVADTQAALDGARAIIMEQLAEDATLVGALREWLWQGGRLCARVVEGEEHKGAKFRDYFDYDEPIARIPSHRLLAVMRARNEGVLQVTLTPPGADEQAGHDHAEARIAAHAGFVDQGRAGDAWLMATARLAWRGK